MLSYFIVIIRSPIFAVSNQCKSHSLLLVLFHYSLLTPRRKVHHDIPNEYNYSSSVSHPSLFKRKLRLNFTFFLIAKTSTVLL